MTRRDILLPITVNALEMYLLGLCVFSGVSGLFGLVSGIRVSDQPTWLDAVWFVMLVVGGGLAIVGNVMRDAIWGLLVTRAAMGPLASGAAMYAVATAYKRQWETAVLVGLFSLVVVLRAIGISRVLRKPLSTGKLP